MGMDYKLRDAIESHHPQVTEGWQHLRLPPGTFDCYALSLLRLSQHVEDTRDHLCRRLRLPDDLGALVIDYFHDCHPTCRAWHRKKVPTRQS